MNPGESRYYQILFTPRKRGTYQHKFNIELIGSPIKYEISCTGYCDIPMINRDKEVIFSNYIQKCSVSKQNQNMVYRVDENTFDFGPVLKEINSGENSIRYE